jgi:hypothetical protein
MSRDGTGTYTLPAGNPVVTGTTISSNWANSTLNDIATALSTTAATTRSLWPTSGQVQDGTFVYLTGVAGTDTITATAPLTMTAYVAGQTFRFVTAGGNSGAVTLNINGIGQRDVTKLGAVALSAGEFASGQLVQVSYDGTRFQTSVTTPTAVVQQIFTATGTYTPTSGMRYCIAEMVGAGGGGYTAAGGSYGGAGGGAGEYARGVFTAANIGASKAVTVGTGGAAGANGGTTSLGTLLTAVGGTGATTGVGGPGGTGGTGTGLHVTGGDGESGGVANASPATVGGSGGASFYGSGGRGGQGNLDNGQAGRAKGSGGGGNGYSGSWSTAGSGSDGLVLVTEYI